MSGVYDAMFNNECRRIIREACDSLDIDLEYNFIENLIQEYTIHKAQCDAEGCLVQWNWYNKVKATYKKQRKAQKDMGAALVRGFTQGKDLPPATKEDSEYRESCLKAWDKKHNIK